MKPIQKRLVDQMAIHDREIRLRKDLLALTDRDEKALAACGDWIDLEIEEIVDSFYDHLTAIDEVARIIGDADTLVRLKSLQQRYILDLFGGTYGIDYVNRRLRIGMAHQRIGVEPKFYLSAVRLLRELLADALTAGVAPEKAHIAIRAMDKLLYFDTLFVVDTYIRSLVSGVEAAKETVESYASSLEERVAERTRELEELARRDSLTGLFNQRAFRESLRRDLSRARRNRAPVSLAYIDVDSFKGVNDAFGHQRGDDVLRSVGAAMVKICRDIDTPCRCGGDEFCLILAGATAENAGRVCRRLIAEFSKQCPDVTLSIGIAQTGPEEFEKPESLIKRADALMYQGKKSPGFQVVLAEAEAPGPPETP